MQIEQFNKEIIGLRKSLKKMTDNGDPVGSTEEMRMMRASLDDTQKQMNMLNGLVKVCS